MDANRAMSRLSDPECHRCGALIAPEEPGYCALCWGDQKAQARLNARAIRGGTRSRVTTRSAAMDEHFRATRRMSRRQHPHSGEE